MKKLLLILSFAFIAISCTSVDSGHKGVMVSYGGETDLSRVYPEGMQYGLSWLVDDMIEYDVREHTMEKEFSFSDKNDMSTTIKVALDYNLEPNDVNLLHVGVKDYLIKIETVLSSASKEVVTQYGAVELNKHKRAEGEKLLSEILKKELPEFHIEFKRVRFTDINIPKGISDLAEQTAVQIGKNELAKKKEEEQVGIAAANVAKAEGEYRAAQFNEKTKELMSQPKLLELYRAETDRIWAEKGVSRYGANNVFGGDGISVIKGLN